MYAIELAAKKLKDSDKHWEWTEPAYQGDGAKERLYCRSRCWFQQVPEVDPALFICAHCAFVHAHAAAAELTSAKPLLYRRTGACTLITMSSNASPTTGRPVSTQRSASVSASWASAGGAEMCIASTGRILVDSLQAYCSTSGTMGVPPLKLGSDRFRRRPWRPAPGAGSAMLHTSPSPSAYTGGRRCHQRRRSRLRRRTRQSSGAGAPATCPTPPALKGCFWPVRQPCDISARGCLHNMIRGHFHFQDSLPSCNVQ